MRVCILTWEFPPRIVGEQALYVDKLARQLAFNGVEVQVVTFQEGGDGVSREQDGVQVSRASNPLATHLNILTWDLTLMTEFERIFSDIHHSDEGGFDLIDAHGWTCLPAAIPLKRAFNTPLLYTVHSLEGQRAQIADDPLSAAISNIEHLGAEEANRILVKTEGMKSEASKLHVECGEKIDVVPPQSSEWIEKVIEVYERTMR